jgi:glycosyltransferase involved in cell wall biosynthesis
MGIASMAVLQVSNNYFISGGSDRYFFELSRSLSGQGMTVIPFAADDPRNEPSDWSSYFPPALRADKAAASDAVRYVYSAAAKRSLKRLLDVADIRLAHCHIYYGRITASILPVLKSAGIPVVQTLHEYKLICPVYTCLKHDRVCEACHGRHFWKATVGRCKNGSIPRSLASTAEAYAAKFLGSHSGIDHFISVSEFLRERMIENEICEPSRITTIHNFVDAERYEPATGDGNYVCYFGRVEKLKGLDTLIESMRRLPDVELKIVGDGSYRRTCEQILAAGGIRNIELVGPKSGNELADLVRGSLCTVLPAEWYENCPMSVLESLAYARPVIGTAIGGIPELIEDGTDGFIVPVADSEALAEAISRLASDTVLATSMGRSGRKKIENEFGRENHLKKIRSIYDQVLN